ncbi:MAG: hypothetical protein WAM26_19695, partial [Nitrososphaeraceae archaeon]
YAIIINQKPENTSKAQARLPSLFSALTGIKKIIEIPRIQNDHTLRNIENLIARDLLDFD